MGKVVTAEKTDVLDQLDPKKYIIIKNARVNNLKNLSVAIPRNKLVVITGLSGSGKSSLAFDTLFAEGQRMYVESLNAYARQFLVRMEKPEVDYIKGISPAIAIEQKINSKNPRSTVGTTTEIYDYLKLLFARIGKTFSPVSGNEVKKHSVEDVLNYINSLPEREKIQILAPQKFPDKKKKEDVLNLLLQKGFSRILIDETVLAIEELMEDATSIKKVKDFHLLIDRAMVNKNDEDLNFRLADSIQTGFIEGEGYCIVEVPGKKRETFSDKFELDGISFEEPSVNLFSFNNPFGACKRCEGFGHVLGIDEDLVFPDKSLSVYEGVIAPWRSEKMQKWAEPLLKNGIKFDFPIHRSYSDLDEKEKSLLWEGNKYFNGLNDFFNYLESKTHKIQYRVMLSRYRGRTTCPDCRGTRLRKDASYVKIDGKSIVDQVLMPISKCIEFFNQIKLNSHEKQVGGRILKEISSRLNYLDRVGLGYLTLNRVSSTLSGGEYQRIRLATSLGSALVGSMYILDEPSIGLHPRDTRKLVSVLEDLRNIGNTVIVVEHEEEVMRAADQIIDIGPDAGAHGGQLIFQGSIEEMKDENVSHTSRYLHGTEGISVPKRRRAWHDFVEVKGARENNLNNLTVKFPLNTLCMITGVSGSGKSTLVKKILYPALKKLHGNMGEFTGRYDGIGGILGKVSQVEFVDQNPIGKSSRSNPVTYVKAYDAIRNLYSEQPLAKARAYKPGNFSFNIEGGRCEICQGEGVVTVEMQFMADIHLKCEGCNGKRFKQEILEVIYKDKNITDVLDMTIDESLKFFGDKPKILEKLKPLADVGLGYIKLGQSSNSLSGGEAQRVKLASFLGKGSSEAKEHILFIFDEPTTGLHFHDIKKLLTALNALVEQGNSVIVIEHNMDMIKCADWIIDMGPEGGDGGGNVTFEGVPEDLVKLKNNYTASFLKDKL
ncbi:excinuclease ABC subunit A [Sporocytophaga myxococcoides]|uniref:UvrABC system protein A n=1 Tax=Sporocytophaga myxococcoides TaxID=153721 RepID=A0A098LBX2_9BACT|nr:excinuclease ABC subunit UvrA [Sporocytophaga myxococcoides]GAL84421.1 excinuclease ABC subunit A [Sporocytophaga myxococcoides]